MKRFICLVLAFAMALVACQADVDTPSSYELSSSPESSIESSSEAESSIEEFVTVLDDGYEGFISVDQNKLVDENGKEYYIKGIAFGNEVFGNPLFASGAHHDEDSYRGLAEMGFNSVRFYLNYRLFEYDDDPYNYRDTGFNWIDTNIKMAKSTVFV